ncbi:Ca2+-binding RTX toxin-like protein [Inquilinus ginsengisoli]|uniref:beta strand repeat-containing protein n=1 Tax=Inquilinus ginsengisoli TaxID=363840 RepID=UPI003D241572
MAIINGDDNPNTLPGTADNDIINGWGGADILSGGGGDDRIIGGTGADTLSGSDGIDSLDYRTTNSSGVTVNLTTLAASGGDAQGDVIAADFENIFGTDFADTLTGSAVENQFYAGVGDDTLSGMAGNDALSGDNGDDVLNGGDGSDTLYGGSGTDQLSGGAGFDLVGYIGGIGVTVNLTTLTASGGEADGDVIGADFEGIIGGAGDDILTGNAGGNTLYGFNGNDSLGGLAGSDSLAGHAGDDLLRGGAGVDYLDGGEGTDTATYYDSAAAVTVDLAGGTGAGGDAQDDSLHEIENVTGSNIDGDTLTGDGGANLLRGYGGNDVLQGGVGADSLFGDAGTDTASYTDSAAGVTVDLAAGTSTGGDAFGDVLTSIENLTGSDGAGGDTLTGSSGANTLRGGGGDDLLRGSGGADSLFGDAGMDTATYYGSASGATVDLNSGHGAGGDAQGDSVSGIENLTGSNIGGDILTGSSGANILRGFGGDDLLRGGAGADTLEGGVGTDLTSYYNSAAAVTVNLAAGTGTGGDAQGDILVSIENLNGSNFADTLTGNGGANVLRGLAGRDTLSGGAGADRFVYGATSESAVGVNRDMVTDFSQAQGDRIDLSLIDADTGTAGNQAFTFIGAGLYTGVAGQLRYSAVGGVTTIAGDVNGDGTSDFHIALTGTFALVAGDFVL